MTLFVFPGRNGKDYIHFGVYRRMLRPMMGTIQVWTWGAEHRHLNWLHTISLGFSTRYAEESLRL